jgi:hypothetical protein
MADSYVKTGNFADMFKGANTAMATGIAGISPLFQHHLFSDYTAGFRLYTETYRFFRFSIYPFNCNLASFVP